LVGIVDERATTSFDPVEGVGTNGSDLITIHVNERAELGVVGSRADDIDVAAIGSGVADGFSFLAALVVAESMVHLGKLEPKLIFQTTRDFDEHGYPLGANDGSPELAVLFIVLGSELKGDGVLMSISEAEGAAFWHMKLGEAEVQGFCPGAFDFELPARGVPTSFPCAMCCGCDVDFAGFGEDVATFLFLFSFFFEELALVQSFKLDGRRRLR